MRIIISCNSSSVRTTIILVDENRAYTVRLHIKWGEMGRVCGSKVQSSYPRVTLSFSKNQLFFSLYLINHHIIISFNQFD